MVVSTHGIAADRSGERGGGGGGDGAKNGIFFGVFPMFVPSLSWQN
eukprot:COSAG06_NODE_54371_length_295_cov_0.520408_1_plen_45_part_10